MLVYRQPETEYLLEHVKQSSYYIWHPVVVVCAGFTTLPNNLNCIQHSHLVLQDTHHLFQYNSVNSPV